MSISEAKQVSLWLYFIASRASYLALIIHIRIYYTQAADYEIMSTFHFLKDTFCTEYRFKVNHHTGHLIITQL